MTATQHAARPAVDWAALGREYCAGVKSDAALAQAFGISRTTVQRHARAGLWVRGQQAMPGQPIRLLPAVAPTTVPQAAPAVHDEAAPEHPEQVIAAHRRDIHRARVISNHLMDELNAQMANRVDLERFAELVAECQAGLRDASGEAVSGEATATQRTRFNTALKTFMAAISLPTRAQTAQRLGEALKSLVGLERGAFGIDKNENGERPEDLVVEALKALYAERSE